MLSSPVKISHPVLAPIRGEFRALVGSCSLSMLRTAAELSRPWPLAIAVDYAIDGHRIPVFEPFSATSLMLLAGASTLLISAAVAGLDLAANRMAERATERVGAELRQSLVNRAFRLPLRWHATMRSSELVSRLTSDVGRVLDAMLATALTLVPDLLAVVGVLIVLLVIDPVLAGLGLIVVPVLAMLSLRQRRRVRASQVAARTASGRLTATAADLLRNVLAVQAFNRIDRANADFALRNDQLLAHQVAAIDVETRWRPISDVVLGVGAALVLTVGGFQVLNGGQSTGQLLVVFSYLADLYSPIRALTRLSALWAKAGASTDRIAEITDADDHQTPQVGFTWPSAPVLTGRLSFEHVDFAYEPGQPVLSDFDLEVESGQTICLYGPSGAGKSTLLLLLLRLYEPDAGTIRVNGVDLAGYDVQSVREQMAYVPQDPWLLDATLAQNVAFGSRTATRAQVLEACRAARVDEFVDRLPLGYDTPLGDAGGRLSGGQRRRVALARAAVSPAALLLLDEPTASLDQQSATEVVGAIRAASVQRTTLIVTHDPAVASIADRVVHLEPGSGPQPVIVTPHRSPSVLSTPQPIGRR